MPPALAAIAALLFATFLPAQTLDEIIARALEARGGAARIRALRSQSLTGTITLGKEPPGRIHVEMKRPGKMREEVTLGGKQMIRVTDGTAGWSWTQDPSGKAIDLQPLPAEAIGNMASSADLDGPFLDYKARGNRIELVGRAEVEGRCALKLTIHPKDRPDRIDYLDCQSYLPVKWTGKLRFEGKEWTLESYFRDYRNVKGLAYSFLIDSLTVGADQAQKLVFQTIDADPDLNDNRFSKP